MTIDISFPPEVAEVRLLVRKFVSTVVNPAEAELRSQQTGGAGSSPIRERRAMARMIVKLRQQARDHHLWLPHMPAEWGGMDLGPTAVAAAFAEAARSNLGPYVLNCQTPDDEAHLALLHWGSDDQKDRYLKPLCEGVARACIASAEPDALPGDGAPSPTTTTTAVADGEGWVVNGRKWFVTGARGAQVAIVEAVIAEKGEKSETTSAFLVDLPAEGWETVRDVETISGLHNQCEVRFTDLRVPASNLLGPPGMGRRVASTRSAPARLADCMKWVADCETALEMMIDRSGAGPASAAGSSWSQQIAETAQDLYQAKLMVLHTASQLEHRLPYESELRMARLFTATAMGRTIERAIAMYGPLGYSTDTPLAEMLKQSRYARVADGADEEHRSALAADVVEAYRRDGSTRAVIGHLPL